MKRKSDETEIITVGVKDADQEKGEKTMEGEKTIEEQMKELFGAQEAKSAEPERQEIIWERVEKNYSWLQHGFCPECGNNDGDLFMGRLWVGHCRKCKVFWTVSEGNWSSTKFETKKNEKLFEGYRLASGEECSKAFKLFDGVLKWLSSFETVTKGGD